MARTAKHRFARSRVKARARKCARSIHIHGKAQALFGVVVAGALARRSHEDEVARPSSFCAIAWAPSEARLGGAGKNELLRYA